MDGRALLEVGGAALACAVAAGTLGVLAGTIDWFLVAGVGLTAAIAAAANYRARRTHSEAVADRAP